MQYVVLDFETYYDDDYSLSKMTTQEYIEDSRFQVIMCSFHWLNQGVTTNVLAPQMEQYLRSIDWANTIVVAHNVQFDGLILSLRYGIHPAMLICTMSMAQSLGVPKLIGARASAGEEGFVALGTFAYWLRSKGYDVPQKGTEVVMAKGKRYEDFSLVELEKYTGYCDTDVDITLFILKLMIPHLSVAELQYQHMVHQAMTRPMLYLDVPLLEQELKDIVEFKRNQMATLAAQLSVTHGELKTILGSADQFAGLLRQSGVAPPTKISPTTGKEAYAFAKADKAMVAMLEGELGEQAKLLASCRIGTKSNMAENRAEKLLNIARLPSRRFCIPHKISGAHTHRGSGSGGINIQNLPTGRVEGQSAKCREAIKSITGYKLAAPDSGQIEARVLAVMANHTELVGIFNSGGCPYSNMAEKIYPDHTASAIKSGDGAYKEAKYRNDVDAVAQFKPFYMYRQTGKAAVLQLGYQAGKDSFLDSVRYTYGVLDMKRADAGYIVNVYRKTNTAITAFWKLMDRVIDDLIHGRSGQFGGPTHNWCSYGVRGIFGENVPSITLPDGMYLSYPMLQYVVDPYEPMEFKAKTAVYVKNIPAFTRYIAKFRKDNGRDPVGWERFYKAVPNKQTGEVNLVLNKGYAVKLYSGKLTENVTQAIAFAVLKWQGIRIDQIPGLSFCFNVHDEHAVTARKDIIGDCLVQAQQIMSTAPEWLPGIKFECDYKIVDNYAAA